MCKQRFSLACAGGFVSHPGWCEVRGVGKGYEQKIGAAPLVPISHSANRGLVLSLLPVGRSFVEIENLELAEMQLISICANW